MPFELHIFRDIRFYFSGTGSIIRHLERLRRHASGMRAELGRFRAIAKLDREILGFEHYSEEIRTLEEAIASDEREIEALSKSIGESIRKHEKK